MGIDNPFIRGETVYVLFKLGTFKGELHRLYSSKSVYWLQGSTTVYVKFIKVFVAPEGAAGNLIT